MKEPGEKFNHFEVWVENVLIASCAELLKTAFKIIPRFDRCRKGSMTVHHYMYLQVLNDVIYFINTSIYLSVWYHYQIYRNWNQCKFMDHKNLCQMILLKMSLCITVWHALWSGYIGSS